MRLRVKIAPVPAEQLRIGLLVGASAICLGLGLPRIALIPALGVTWNAVPGVLLLAWAGLRYGPRSQEEETGDPVVGFWALLVGLPFLSGLASYYTLARHWVVGGDPSLLGGIAQGEMVAPGWIPWIVMALVGPNISALLYGSLVVHCANAVLVGLLALRVSRDRGVGLLAGVLFASFPISVEAVAWLSGYRLLEGSLLVLGSLVLAFGSRPPERSPLRVVGVEDAGAEAELRRGRELMRRAARRQMLASAAWVGSLICLVAALMKTPVAVIVPLVLMVLELRDRNALDDPHEIRRSMPAVLLRASGHLLVLLGFFVLRIWFGVSPALDAEPRVASGLTLIGNLIAFPRDLLIPLSPVYYKTQPLIIFVGIILMTMLLLAALLRAKPSREPVLAGLVMTVLFALPVLPYLRYDQPHVGTRYLYLAAGAYVIVGAIYLRNALRLDRYSGGWLLVGLAMAVSVGSLRNNLRLWRQTSRLTSDIQETLLTISQRVPAGSWIVLDDWPESLDGVPFPGAEDFQATIDSFRQLNGGVEITVSETPPPGGDPGPPAWTYRWDPEIRWLVRSPERQRARDPGSR